MSSYHTKALANADIFTVMGSIYAEVARYDSALIANTSDQAAQAVARATEIIDFAQKLKQLSKAQKMEIKQFSNVFLGRAKEHKPSKLDSYLMPFAIAQRMRQFS